MPNMSTRNETVVVVKVKLDDISEKYAKSITADSLSKRLRETCYSSAVCKGEANDRLQRNAKRGR